VLSLSACIDLHSLEAVSLYLRGDDALCHPVGCLRDEGCHFGRCLLGRRRRRITGLTAGELRRSEGVPLRATGWSRCELLGLLGPMRGDIVEAESPETGTSLPRELPGRVGPELNQAVYRRTNSRRGLVLRGDALTG
jgi:hypothetical protein